MQKCIWFVFFLLLQTAAFAQCCKKTTNEIELKESYKTTFHGGHRYSGYSVTYHLSFLVNKSTVLTSVEVDTFNLVLNKKVEKAKNLLLELVLTINHQPQNPISGFEGGTECTIQQLVSGEPQGLPFTFSKRTSSSDCEVVIYFGKGKRKGLVKINKVPLKESIQAP